MSILTMQNNARPLNASGKYQIDWLNRAPRNRAAELMTIPRRHIDNSVFMKAAVGQSHLLKDYMKMCEEGTVKHDKN